MTNKYLIWSNEHNAWWRPAHAGYTDSTDRAGRYSEAEALKICNGANWDWNTDKIKSIPNELPIHESIAGELIYKNEV